jgi:hypothetical protein
MVYTQCGSTCDGHKLYIVNSDGSNKRDLATGYAAAWSGDGSKLVFIGTYVWPDGNRITYFTGDNVLDTTPGDGSGSASTVPNAPGLAAGNSARLTVRLSAKGLSLLQRHNGHLTATLMLTPARGTAIRRTVKLNLPPPRTRVPPARTRAG